MIITPQYIWKKNGEGYTTIKGFRAEQTFENGFLTTRERVIGEDRNEVIKQMLNKVYVK